MTESARTCESPEARMITRGSIAEAWMPTLGTPHAGQTRSPRHAALPPTFVAALGTSNAHFWLVSLIFYSITDRD